VSFLSYIGLLRTIYNHLKYKYFSWYLIPDEFASFAIDHMKSYISFVIFNSFNAQEIFQRLGTLASNDKL